jgi:hypothetical protein
MSTLAGLTGRFLKPGAFTKRMDDNNGGRIALNYKPKQQELTISKGRLKLVYDIRRS